MGLLVLIKKNGLLEVDSLSLIKEILKAQKEGLPREEIALLFHLTLADIALTVSQKIRSLKKINKVVLSGGVFQNRILREETKEKLELNNFKVFLPDLIPIHDGGLALGQVGVAAFSLRS